MFGTQCSSFFESPPSVKRFGSGIRKQALATSTTASLTPSLNVQKPSRALPLWSGQRGGKQAGTRPGQEGIRQRAQFSEPASLSLSPPQSLHHRQTHTSEAANEQPAAAAQLSFGTDTQCPIRDHC